MIRDRACIDVILSVWAVAAEKEKIIKDIYFIFFELTRRRKQKGQKNNEIMACNFPIEEWALDICGMVVVESEREKREREAR